MEPSSPSIGSYSHPSSKEEYVSQRVFHDKSNLCRIPLPYIYDEPVAKPDTPKKTKPKKMRKRKPALTGIKPKVPFKPTLSY